MHNLKGGREGVSTQRHQGANQVKDNIRRVVIRERRATLIMANPLGTGWFSLFDDREYLPKFSSVTNCTVS
jgi:hypothetical protein